MFTFAALALTFQWFWLGWFILFVIIEGIALWLDRNKGDTTDNGGTLSEVIWRVTNENKLFFAIFVAFWGVLAYHFFIYK